MRNRGNYSIRSRAGRSSVSVIAPHGGRIELGTSEIAEAIAGTEHSFYAFEGLKANRNRELHITSTHFDEPRALELLARSERAIAIHGKRCPGVTVFVGGRDQALVEGVKSCLLKHGFDVKLESNHLLAGMSIRNICNRTRTGSGVQLELARGLRSSLMESRLQTKDDCGTTDFTRFVDAIREALRTDPEKGRFA